MVGVRAEKVLKDPAPPTASRGGLHRGKSLIVATNGVRIVVRVMPSTDWSVLGWVVADQCILSDVSRGIASSGVPAFPGLKLKHS